jgi:hypothetical protein
LWKNQVAFAEAWKRSGDFVVKLITPAMALPP